MIRPSYKYDKILPVRLVSGLSEQEHLFALITYVLGYSATKAYRMAINPKVSVSSAASLGCRLLQEPRIQNYIRILFNYRERFITNDDAIKYQ